MLDGFAKKDTENKKTAYIVGGLVGVLSTLATMLIFAAVLLVFNIDRAYAVPFATISVAMGSFIASYIAAKKINNKGYLTGLVIGIVVFAIISILSLIFGNIFSLNTIFHLIIITLTSIVGGILGVNADKHKKYI